MARTHVTNTGNDYCIDVYMSDMKHYQPNNGKEIDLRDQQVLRMSGRARPTTQVHMIMRLH